MPGTSSHTKICLNGKGLKRVNALGQGNHYVDLKIKIPKTLSEEQKALLQAYAELEENTPGQIMGITNKTDGKSTDGTMSDKFTQRSKDRDNYEEHDPTGTVEYHRKQSSGPNFYFYVGIGIVVLTFFLLFQSNAFGPMDLDYEREQVYKRLAEREQERRVEEEQRKSRVGPFRDA